MFQKTLPLGIQSKFLHHIDSVGNSEIKFTLCWEIHVP